MGQPYIDSLWARPLFHQALDSPPVSENIRTPTKGQHVHVCWGASMHLDYLDFLPSRHSLQHRFVLAKGKDLESVDDYRPLLQYLCYFSSCWDIQRANRLCDLFSPHAISLEVADAKEKKDTNDGGLCNGFSVSSMHPEGSPAASWSRHDSPK